VFAIWIFVEYFVSPNRYSKEHSGTMELRDVSRCFFSTWRF
jgi:hypothetical protein